MCKGFKRQAGFGLLELLLVLVIAALLFIMGFRLYEKQKMQNDIEEARKNVQLLLHSTANYYYAYCAQDINGPPPSTTIPGYYDQYERAQEMLGDLQTPKILTLANLQSKDAYGNQFLENTFHLFFAFGTFTDNSMYRIKLVHLPYQANQCASASNTQMNIPQNCFAQTGLWQTQVSACVTAFTTVTYDPKDPKKKPSYTPPDLGMLKGMFQPDNISNFNAAPDCVNGDVLTWESIPSIQQPSFSDQGDVVSAASQRQFNQMYRYGPWMQQGSLSTDLKEKLEYLCQ